MINAEMMMLVCCSKENVYQLMSYMGYKKDKEEDKDLHIYHSGIAKRNLNLGWKIARRFDLSKIEGSMKDGLLKLFIPLTPESKPKTVSNK